VLRTLVLLVCGLCLSLGSLSAGPEAKPAPPTKAVTITGELPLSKALASFTRQTGIPVVNQLGSEDPTLKLSLKNTGFWQALDAIAAATGGRVNVYAGDGRIELVSDLRKDKTEKLPVSYSGPARVSLRRLVAVRDFETGARGYTATMDIAWEPTFLAFFLQTVPQRLTMLDAAGKPQKLSEERSAWAAVDGRSALPVDVHLPALDRKALTIGKLHGTFLLRAPSKMLTFSLGKLADLAKRTQPLTMTIEGTSVTVSDVKLSQARWSVRVTTKLPPGGLKFDSSQFWDVNNDIYLLHKDGKTRLVRATFARDTAGRSSRAVLTYDFVDTRNRKRGKPEDWTLVYRAPASFIEVPVPFEFKDVKLP
jgi:hypothetical protein